MRPVLPSSSPREPFDPFLPDIPRPAPRPTRSQLTLTLSYRQPARFRKPWSRIMQRADRWSCAAAHPHIARFAGLSLSLVVTIRPLYGEGGGQMRQKKSRAERWEAPARVAWEDFGEGLGKPPGEALTE